jgi:hypothetical protein
MAVWSGVCVPVVSDQVMETEPVGSTPASLRMRAFRFTSRCSRRARTMVTPAGRPSWTVATLVPVIDSPES